MYLTPNVSLESGLTREPEKPEILICFLSAYLKLESVDPSLDNQFSSFRLIRQNI